MDHMRLQICSNIRAVRAQKTFVFPWRDQLKGNKVAIVQYHHWLWLLFMYKNKHFSTSQNT